MGSYRFGDVGPPPWLVLCLHLRLLLVHGSLALPGHLEAGKAAGLGLCDCLLFVRVACITGSPTALSGHR